MSGLKSIPFSQISKAGTNQLFIKSNVATLEMEFYFKLLKRHTKELFLWINEKNILIFMYILKPSMYKRYLKNNNKWYLKTVFFHSKLKIQ